jgi:AraC-like DNA-binding protein
MPRRRNRCASRPFPLGCGGTVFGVWAMQRDPLREWQDEYARRGTRIGFMPAARFSFAVKPIFDTPRIVRTRLTPGMLFRDRSMLRDADDRLSLTIGHAPLIQVRHRGREVQLRRGDAALFQADAPGSVASSSAFAVIELVIPQSEWTMRGARPGDLLARAIGRSCEGLDLLSAYVRALEMQANVAAADARETVRRHLIDLAVLAATRLRPVGESSESAIVAARRAALSEYVEARLSDPGLDVTSVANALRLSPRYIQRLLRASGTSLTAYVNELRLQRAFAVLTSADQKGQRIADIAMMTGFSDVSYFNRLFRARFGDTPSGVRQGASADIEVKFRRQ